MAQLFSLGDFAHMDSKQTALADYVLCLSQSLEHTHHANDRPLYHSYLSDVAVILAMLVRGADASQLQVLVHGHDRLLGYSWLAGPEHAVIAESWQKFKSLL